MSVHEFGQLGFEELKGHINVPFRVDGNFNVVINNVAPIDQANSQSLVWCSSTKKQKQQLVDQTSASVIICDESINLSDDQRENKAFFIVDDPKLAFTRLLRSVLNAKQKKGIHPSSTIHPEAEIASSAVIGPNCTIGKCFIDENSILHGNNFVYDGTTIGKNVLIEAGAILGAEGFGMAQNEHGGWERFPHVGGLVLHDNVEVGAGTTIDKGALDDTVIGAGTKISKSAHISHNVKIGENCLITGCVSIAGSTTIGDNVWISPGVTILNQLTIGNDVFISIGATITQNIPDNYQAIGRKILPKTT